MQVRKFEAKTMKEALSLVKHHLGPEAIILSARDNGKGFGLLGEKSFEVTAAVSETTLMRKKAAESRLNSQYREKLTNSSARVQREFIEKALAVKEKKVAPVKRPPTSIPYIEIGEEELSATPKPPPPQPIQSQVEIAALRSEIRHLKGIIERFQKVPQSFLSMHPGAEEGIPFELSFMYQKLLKSGVMSSEAIDLLKQAQQNLSREQIKRKAFVDAWVAKYFLDNIKISEDRNTARTHIFVGPSGHGKTASLVKLASHLVICEKKKVAILTADSFKVGAAEQLRIYAQILNIPFGMIRRQEDWQWIQEKLQHMDHILVDLPGLQLKSLSEIDRFRNLLPVRDQDTRVHYVQSVLAKDEDAFELASRYQVIGLDDVIFTNLDETTKHGIIFNFQRKFNLPLHSFGIGPQIPEDFEAATKERVVDLLFKISKIKSTANKERGNP